jgi:hypothetical protein
VIQVRLMVEENLLFSAILDEIRKNPPPCEVSSENIENIFEILEKNQYRVNRSRSKEKISKIIDLIVTGD